MAGNKLEDTGDTLGDQLRLMYEDWKREGTKNPSDLKTFQAGVIRGARSMRERATELAKDEDTKNNIGQLPDVPL